MPQVLASDYKSKTYYHDHDTTFTIQKIVDVESTLEHAKYLSRSGQDRNANGDLHVGRFPTVIVAAWCNQRGCTYDQLMGDNRLFDEFLRDPAHAAFRVYKGDI